jgi:hypothetical protein
MAALCVQPAVAQNSGSQGDSPVIKLSGTSRTEGQYSDRQGSEQETPRNYGRWEIDPVVSLYDIPFSMHMLLSSEQSVTRQNINSFNVSFNLNTQKLQDLLRTRITSSLQSIAERDDIQRLRAAADVAEDPEKLKDSLKEHAPDQLRDLEKLEKLERLSELKSGDLAEYLPELRDLDLISGTEKFIFNFPTLGIGVNYPNYSPMLLSGVPVTGIDFEFNPGMFYMAATGGKAQSAIRLIDSNYVAFKRQLYAGKIGFGRKMGGHLYVTGLYARDDESSVLFDTSATAPTTVTTPPQSNYVLGIEANIPFVEQYFSVQGELLGSVLTGDTRSAGIASSDIPDLIVKLIDPKISSSVDYSYSASGTVNIPEIAMKLKGSVKRIGPGFYSLGSPYLRNDLMRIEGRLDQGFLRRQITFTGYFRQEHDNLIVWKDSRTTLTSFGLNLGLNFRNLPFFRLGYVPYIQKNDRTDSLRVENRTSMFNLAAGYGVNLSGIYSLTNASFATSSTSTLIGAYDYGTSTFALNEAVNFQFPLSLSAGFSLTQPTKGSDTLRVTSFDLAGSYTAYDVWQSALGLTLSNQNTIGNKVGFFVATYFPIGKFGNMEVRAEKNRYDDKILKASNYDEVIFRAIFTSAW